MPLEDLTGNKYINSLNADWPAGTDYPDAGDDHIRGVKNVVKNSFPNITGPITRTQTQINQGSVPIGSRLPFYQAAAPVGWARVAGLADTYMLRVVASTIAGGGSGGTDDPIENSKVPSHTHPVSGTSSIQSANHNHAGSVGTAGQHGHNIRAVSGNQDNNWGANSLEALGLSGTTISGTYSYITNLPGNGSPVIALQLNGDHVHTVSLGNQSVDHTHNLTATAAAPAGAVNWTPRYLDVIVCERQT